MRECAPRAPSAVTSTVASVSLPRRTVLAIAVVGTSALGPARRTTRETNAFWSWGCAVPSEAASGRENYLEIHRKEQCAYRVVEWVQVCWVCGQWYCQWDEGALGMWHATAFVLCSKAFPNPARTKDQSLPLLEHHRGRWRRGRDTSMSGGLVVEMWIILLVLKNTICGKTHLTPFPLPELPPHLL